MTTQMVRPEVTAEVGPILLAPGYEVEHPESTVFSDAFPAGAIDGWVAGTNSTISLNSTFFKTASPALRLGRSSGTGTAIVSRTVTGFVVGASYTFSAWVAVNNAGALGAQIGVEGIGLSTAVNPTAGAPMVQVSRQFTATMTSHTLTMQISTGNTAWASWWDDVTVTRDAWIEEVPPEYGTEEVPVSEGEVTLDDGWSPYVQATLTVPITDPELVEQIDPRTAQRVTVTATEAISGDTRTFDLGLRERTIDHKDGTIELTLASDEALLLDRCNVSTTVDDTPRSLSSSLRDIVDWALGKIGASLEAGSDDADMTPYWPLTNYLTNPNVVGSTAGYLTGSGSTSIAYNSGAGFSGTGFLRASQTGAGGAVFLAPTSTGGFSVQPGRTYTVASYVRVSTSTSTLTMNLRWQDQNGNTIATVSPTGTAVGTSWTRISHTATAPAGAVRCTPYISIAGSANGRTWDIDASIAVEDSELPDYFDGSTSAGGGYTYEWTGTANASASTRTPVVDRPRELFNWTPGQNLWDFLQPLLEASGLRLFCDEQRVWRLVDPATYEVPGYVVVQAQHNATEGSDSITRNDDTWADAVVCVYQWDDEFGISREAYDVAGDPDGKCFTRVYEDTPFPGPGAAAYLLGRLQGKGRTQDVRALYDLDATPGQSLTVTLPGTLSQTGKVSRVTFDLRQGLMEIGSRGLTDTLPGSWWAWEPADQVWDDVSGTLTWDEA